MKTGNIAVLAAAALALAAAQAGAYEWRGLTPASRIGGRLLSPGYMRGKVVLIDVRDFSDASPDELKKVQSVWDAYRTKPFVALGVHTGPSDADSIDAARMALARAGAAYPVYSGAALAGVELRKGSVYVVDSTGDRVLYAGGEVRVAAGVAGPAIIETKLPSTPARWRALVEYEMKVLPGHALNRIHELFSTAKQAKAFAAEYPEEAKRYGAAAKEMAKDPEIRDLAKLVALADTFKDTDFAAKTARRVNKAAVEKLVEKYLRLKSSENEFVAQEAKNAIADLTFAVASAANAEAAKDAARRPGKKTSNVKDKKGKK